MQAKLHLSACSRQQGLTGQVVAYRPWGVFLWVGCPSVTTAGCQHPYCVAENCVLLEAPSAAEITEPNGKKDGKHGLASSAGCSYSRPAYGYEKQEVYLATRVVLLA